MNKTATFVCSIAATGLARKLTSTDVCYNRGTPITRHYEVEVPADYTSRFYEQRIDYGYTAESYALKAICGFREHVLTCDDETDDMHWTDGNGTLWIHAGSVKDKKTTCTIRDVYMDYPPEEAEGALPWAIITVEIFRN